MYLPGAFRAIRLLFLASCVIASPLPGPVLQPRAPGDSAITTGILRFGIELETILKVREDGKTRPNLKLLEILAAGKGKLAKKKEPVEFLESDAYLETFDSIRKFLVTEWKTYNEPAKSKPNNNEFKRYELVNRWGDKPGPEDKVDEGMYSAWSITEDTSLKTEKNAWQFPIEFVSPVLEIGTSEYWYNQARYQIELFFSFLEHCGFQIVKSESTSTHVHVSPLQDPREPAKSQWTTKRVQQMAWAAFFFEPAIDAALPEYEDGSYFAKLWRTPDWMRQTTIDQSDLVNKELVTVAIIAHLDKPDIKGIYNVMNPKINGHGGRERYWVWNFQNLKKGGKNTIEFRKGAQSMNAKDAMLYVEFVAGFTLAACAHGHYSSLEDNFDIDVKSLHKFIYHDWPTAGKTASGASGPSLKHGYQPGFKFPELQKQFISVLSANKKPATPWLDPNFLADDSGSDTSSHFSEDDEREFDFPSDNEQDLTGFESDFSGSDSEA